MHNLLPREGLINVLQAALGDPGALIHDSGKYKDSIILIGIVICSNIYQLDFWA